MVDLQAPPQPAQQTAPSAATDAVLTRELMERTRRWLKVGLSAAAIDGALTVFIYLVLVLPRPEGSNAEQIELINLGVLIGYLAISVPVATIWSTRRSMPIWNWLERGGPATDDERSVIVRQPREQALLMLTLWVAAAALFGLVNLALATATIAGDIFMTISLASLSVAALAYLITERIVRPVVARAFIGVQPQPAAGIGVLARILLTWAFCTGIPLLGIGLAFIHRPTSELNDLVLPTYFLVGVGLAVGLLGMVFAAKSVAEPLAGVRRAMAEVGRGNTEVQVPVDDMSEIGQLQAGFNHMTEGLRERQQLADLFGRQVGVEVAREALERGVSLGGEARDAAVLFVDIVGSTALATYQSPAEIVERLNAFFKTVVEVVDRHHGWINKFEGDAALCVFGVPVPRDDAATCALAAARELRDRLQESGDLDAGIGLAAGTVIAGNVGAEERYEYTVIGDPVNEAARLTELAKTRPERVVASSEVLARAEPAEADNWRADGEITLRGRLLTTRLAVPAA